jgi:hypothetical protein
MTPMQRLKNQFDSFKQQLPSQFVEVALNKSSPKFFEYPNYISAMPPVESKGVRSDFIKTFKAKFNDTDSYSIGFSFQYLDLSPDEHTVTVSLKIGNRQPMYFYGNTLSIENFKTVFSNTIEQIGNMQSPTCKEIANTMKTNFDLQPNQKIARTSK